MDEGFYKALLDNLYDGVYFVDRDRRISYWNTGAERITGYPRTEVIGKQCFDNVLCHVDDAGRNLCVAGCPLAFTMSDGAVRECEIYLKHKDGHRVPVVVRAAPMRDKDGAVVGAVEVFSSNVKAAQYAELIQRLQNEAMQDALTQLGNRRFAEMNLDNHIRARDRHEMVFGVLFLDLDHFKAINDLHGHNGGDAILRMVSRTIVHGIRPLDIPCRWGGEEFLVILPNIDLKALSVVANRLRMLVQKSWLAYEGRQLRITTSIGGAMAMPGETWQTLIERADRQVYVSKHAGRNRVNLDDGRT